MRVQAEVYSCFIANQPVATSLPRSHGGRANSNRRTGRALMEARTNLVAVVAHHLATSGLHGEEDEWPGFGLTFGQEESTLRVG